MQSTVYSAEEKSKKISDLGILGTAGYSAGMFLKSPFTNQADQADIQVTLYPSVRIRIFEIHRFLMLTLYCINS